MPKTAIDYSNIVIYKLKCNDLNITEEYVGSTCNFTKRKWAHKQYCKTPTLEKNQKIYSFIRDNGGWDNWSMIEIEKFPCKDNNEARAREQYYIELNQSKLNMMRSFITDDTRKEETKEFQKEYRIKHNIENKEYQKEYQKITILCTCGKEVKKAEMSKHIKRKIHLNHI